MSGFWDVLGIAPTFDARAIKRAYAQRLKATRPDDDPKGFQHLRAAYEAALASTQGRKRPSRQIQSEIETPAQPPRELEQQAVSSGEPVERPPPQVEARATASPLSAEEISLALAEPLQQPYPQRARDMVRVVFLSLAKEGDRASAHCLLTLVGDQLVELDLRDLFEAELLRRLAAETTAPLHLLAAGFRAFHWDDRRHPLRPQFDNLLEFAAEAERALAALSMLNGVAAGEDEGDPNRRQRAEAARLLLDPNPELGSRLWSVRPGVLTAMGEMLNSLDDEFGPSVRLILPDETVALWRRSVHYHKPQGTAYFFAYSAVTAVAAAVLDVEKYFPALLRGNAGVDAAILFSVLVVASVLFLAGRQLAVWHALLRAGLNDRFQQYRSALALIGTPVALVGLLLVPEPWHILSGVLGYVVMLYWIADRSHFLAVLVASLLPASLLVAPVRDLSGDAVPFGVVHLLAMVPTYGLLRAIISEPFKDRVWRPVRAFGEGAGGRAVAALSALILAGALFFLDEVAQVYAGAAAYLFLAYWANHKGVLFGCIAIGFFATGKLIEELEHYAAVAPAFFGVHVLVTAAGVGLSLGYTAFRQRHAKRGRRD